MAGCSVDGCVRTVCALGMCKLHYYRTKRNGTPGPAGLIKAPSGTGCVSSRGYVRVGAKRRPMHVLIAEAAIGKQLPVGTHVHHVNGVKSDNRPGNLVVCPDQKYHALLHLRQRALDACGNAGHRICAFCGQYSDPETMQKSGPQFRHRDCYNAYQRKQYAEKTVKQQGE